MTQNEAFEILGVKPGASAKETKAAYLQKAKVTHPDQGGSDDAMKKLNEAFEIAIGKARGSKESDAWAKENEAKRKQEREEEKRKQEREEAKRKQEREEEKEEGILFRSIRLNNISAVQDLIRNNPGMVNTVFNYEYKSPLRYAIDLAKLEKYLAPELMTIIKLLLDAGANPNLDSDGRSLLGKAIGAGPNCVDCLRLLLAAGANPNVIDSKYGSVMHIWLEWYFKYPDNIWVEMIQFFALVRAGADLNIKDQNGKTVLDYALESGDQNLITRLIAYGARPSNEDRSSKSAWWSWV